MILRACLLLVALVVEGGALRPLAGVAVSGVWGALSILAARQIQQVVGLLGVVAVITEEALVCTGVEEALATLTC